MGKYNSTKFNRGIRQRAWQKIYGRSSMYYFRNHEYKAESAMTDNEILHEYAYRNGARKPNSSKLTKREVNRLVQSLTRTVYEKVKIDNNQEKAALYDKIIEARAEGQMVELTQRECQRLLDKEELLLFVDRDAVKKAVRKRKIK